MKLRIYIDDIELEGVSPSAFKLNITNADPLKYSERSSSYSASVDVPRTEVNDRVFRREREPWLFKRTKPYKCKLSFDGMTAPVGEGRFKVTCTADKDSYKLNFIEEAVKFSTVAPIICHNIKPRRLNLPMNIGYVNIVSELNWLYPSVAMPDVFGYEELLYIADLTEVNVGNLVGVDFKFIPYKAYDGIDKGMYLDYKSLVMDNANLSTAAKYCEGSVFTMKIAKGSYIIKPPTYTGSSATFQVKPGNSVFSFSTRSVMPDGNLRFEAGEDISVTASSPYNTQGVDSIYLLCTDSVYVQEEIPVQSAINISASFTIVSEPTTVRKYIGDCGFGSGTEIVESLCKAFNWTYEFDYKTGKVTMREVIAPDAITNDDSTYRRVWPGEVRSVKSVKDVAGIGRTMQYKVGDLEYRFAAYAGAVDAVAEASESSIPLTNGSSRPFARMCLVNDAYISRSDFFSNPTKYSKTLTDYYRLFGKGYEMEVEADASYFDVANFVPNACYRFAGLNEWYYIRSIKNWNPEANTATFTLVALDIEGYNTELLPIPDDPIITSTPLGVVTIS